MTRELMLYLVAYLLVMGGLASCGKVHAQDYGCKVHTCGSMPGELTPQVADAPRPVVPFDVPAKEWDGPDTHDEQGCDPTWAVNCPPLRVKNHHIDCDDKKRALTTTQDGKHHCYAFYLLGEIW